MSVDTSAAEAMRAALDGGYASGETLAWVEPESVFAAVAAVREEYPDYAPSDCAPLIAWTSLRRRGEGVDEYRDRVLGA